MKKALALTLIIALSVLAAAGINFTNAATTYNYPLPLTVSIPSVAYGVTNYDSYDANNITLYFLVDHDTNFRGAGVAEAYYGYILDKKTNVTFTPSSQTFEYHYYSNGGLSVTEINGVSLYNLPKGEHSIVIYAKMYPIISGTEKTGVIIDFGSTFSVSNTKLFTVNATLPEATPPEEPQLNAMPFPIAYSMGIVAVIVLVLLGLTVFILKRKD
jgi:hypothetical protein